MTDECACNPLWTMLVQSSWDITSSLGLMLKCVIHLKANDADFKELLRRVVAMDVWPKARADYIKEWVSVVACL
eukprot:1161947-Pelagomonas_calceolata.AAC.5